jgi:hypothetical protein
VLEELSISMDTTLLRHDQHDVPYSRLLRLQRLPSLNTYLERPRTKGVQCERLATEILPIWILGLPNIRMHLPWLGFMY